MTPVRRSFTSARALSSLRAGQRGMIEEIALSPDAASWLRAVGVTEGKSVQLLRQAPFGGPLHVRIADTSEFAIDASLAASITVHTEAQPEPGE